MSCECDIFHRHPPPIVPGLLIHLSTINPTHPAHLYLFISHRSILSLSDTAGTAVHHINRHQTKRGRRTRGHSASCSLHYPRLSSTPLQNETDYHILVAVLACSLSSSLPRALCPPLFDNHCPVSHSISIRYCLLACFACFQVASQNQRTQLASP